MKPRPTLLNVASAVGLSWPAALRLECLALAVERRTPGAAPDAIMATAEGFYQWVMKTAPEN